MTTPITKEPLYAEVHNVPDDYHFTDAELERIIAGDMFTPRQGAIMARELRERRKAAMDAEPVADKLGRCIVAFTDKNVGIPLYTAPPAPVAPDGWKLVPIEPTLKMIKSGANAASTGMLIPGMYRAMLASAPRQEGK